MTSVRVSVEGREEAFPLGTTIRIGAAPAADIVINSPAISLYHARIYSDGRSWWLAAEAGTDVWVAGARISTIAVQDETTAWLGPHGEIALRLQVSQEPAQPYQPVAPPPAAQQPPVPPPSSPQQLAPPFPAEQAPVTGGPWSPGAAAGRATAAPVSTAHRDTAAGPAATAGRTEAPAGWTEAPAVRTEAPAGWTEAPAVRTEGTPGRTEGTPGRTEAPAGWTEGAAGLTITGLTIGGQDRLPVVITRIGGVQRVFPVGTQVRIGRDPALELVSVNPLVSRQVHGLITSDERGATYTDMSRRGTFLNGRKLHGPLRVTESVILRLGDPATGEELGITPPLTSTEIDHNRERRVLRGRLRAVAVAVAAVGVAAGLAAYFLTGSGTSSTSSVASSSPLAGGTPEAVLLHAEDATVRLLLGSPTNYTGWGSGTVIAPTGLILTNAHVAEPQAPGAAVALGLPGSQLSPNPSYLTVEITTGPASPVMARYRARPVEVDGYLDFAVVQIYATSNGTPVNPAALHLPYLPLGSDTGVQLDQPVTVLGFPGVADSDSITVTNGVISTFVPDPLGHVRDPRFELETTARLAHGNSGGAAINNSGQLIGVPSLEVTGEGGDLSWRLRSIAEALPLITAARDHSGYQSKILVQRTGSEQVTGVGIGTTASQACSGTQSVAATGSATYGVSYAQVPVGLDLALLIALPNGTVFSVPTGGLPQSIATASNGCLALALSAQQLGLTTLPTGTYQIQLYGGPSLTPIGQSASVTVSTSGTP